MPRSSIEFCTLVFVLSAIAPDKFSAVRSGPPVLVLPFHLLVTKRCQFHWLDIKWLYQLRKLPEI